MKSMILILTLILFLGQNAFSQTVEKNVDFTISPSIVSSGKIHMALEWLTPNDFSLTQMGMIDQAKLQNLYPENNQIIASKIAFIARKSFAELSHAKMNEASYIAHMLNSVSISPKSQEIWKVTNKVRAYGLPFKVSFDLRFKEVSSATLGQAVAQYFRDEASGISGTGKERFLLLDMTNFSKLMYRNYSIVYVKEISPTETLVISGLIAAFDIKTANGLFQFHPLSSTYDTMMGNLRTQILHMTQSIR